MEQTANTQAHLEQVNHVNRGLDAASSQLARTMRIEIVRKRQRERLLRLLAESITELGISREELRIACREYKLKQSAGRR